MSICPKLLSTLTNPENWKFSEGEWGEWYAAIRLGDYKFKSSRRLGSNEFEEVRFNKRWWIFPISETIYLEDCDDILKALNKEIDDHIANRKSKREESLKRKTEAMFKALC